MKLKICGMKYPNNISEVASLQPDYLGFIFYEKSSRFFQDCIPELPKNIKKVGVFVNATQPFVLQQITTHELDAIQLHGNESANYCMQLKTLFSTKPNDKPIEIIKAFSIANTFNFKALETYLPVCNYFLFDTKGELPGGNGFTFNWNILKNYPYSKPYFLSGGIGLEQIESLKKFNKTEASKYCYAIDVNSKFETKPGLKNRSLLKKFKSQL